MTAFAFQRRADKVAELKVLDVALASIASEGVTVAEAQDVVRSHVASGEIDRQGFEIAMAKDLFLGCDDEDTLAEAKSGVSRNSWTFSWLFA